MIYSKDQDHYPELAAKMADQIMKDYPNVWKGQRREARADLENSILADLEEYDDIDVQSEEYNIIEESHSESFVESWQNRN